MLLSLVSQAQTSQNTCGQSAAMEQLFKERPEIKNLHNLIEARLLASQGEGTPQRSSIQTTNSSIVLPVVVHIIHEGGSENISDAQVIQGIQDLNEAFENSGFYDPSDGVKTDIQFCLAKRDPSGNFTTGITRNFSSLTRMDRSFEDQSLKDLNRWDPNCYINIWLVDEICVSGDCDVAGYAYLPSTHGLRMDGIVEESRYFGSSKANSVVTIHEMGHYLGLYHTFEGSCTNKNCSVDGDKVCDTPPDQSLAAPSCTLHMNSCSTDSQSGFSTDENDLKEDYMDYGNFNCMKVFTKGQADRMRWFIENVRTSLLNCTSCLDPCPYNTSATFTASSSLINIGDVINFTNSSAGADQYEWYVDDTLRSSSFHFSYLFNTAGTYTIKLVAKNSGSNLCSKEYIREIEVRCNTTSGFTPAGTTVNLGSTIQFANNSTAAGIYKWFVNGRFISSTHDFSYTFSEPGDQVIELLAINKTDSTCFSNLTKVFNVTCLTTASFLPKGSMINVGDEILFKNNSLFADEYEWYLNDKVIAVSKDFRYRFSQEGEQFIKLISRNSSYPNCFKEYTQRFTVQCPVVPRFESTNRTTRGSTVSFTNSSLHADQYAWYINDVLQSTAANFSYLFTSAGTFKVKLVAKNSVSNCTREFIKTIGVDCNVEAIFTTPNRYISVGSTIDFQNTSVAADMFEWYIDNKLVTSAINLSYTFSEIRRYDIKLIARNSVEPSCIDSSFFSLITQCYDTADFVVSGTPMLNGTILFTNTSVGATSYRWTVNGIPQSNAKDFEFTFTQTGLYEIALNTSGSCARTKKAKFEIFVTGLDDSCFEHTFRLVYGHVETDFSFWRTHAEDFITTADGGYLLSSFGYRDYDEMVTDPYIVKFNKKGNYEWLKYITGPGIEDRRGNGGIDRRQHKLIATPDGNILSLYMFIDKSGGINKTDTELRVWKFDQNGNPIWNKSTTILDATEYDGNFIDAIFQLNSAVITKDNEVFFAFQKSLRYSGRDSHHSKLFIGKLNSTGGLISCDSISTGPGVHAFGGMVEFNGTIYLTVNKTEANLRTAYLLRYETASGRFAGTVKYGDGVSSVLFYTPSFSGKRLYIAGKYSERPGKELMPARFEIDPSNYQVLKIIQFDGDMRHFYISKEVHFAADGKTGTLSGSPIEGLYEDIIFQLDEADTIKWSYLRPGVAHGLGAREIFPADDGGYSFWHNTFETKGGAKNNVEILKVDKDGRLKGCDNKPDTLKLGTYYNLPQATANTISGNVPFVKKDLVLFLRDTVLVQWQKECSDSLNRCLTDTCLTNCSTIKVSGMDTVCNFTDIFTYKAKRNVRCDLPVEWSFDQQAAEIIDQSDSSVSFRFLKAGNFKLIGRIINDCIQVTDTLSIHVLTALSAPELGENISLCRSSTVNLKAGSGYKSYLWQDGSMDSTYTAYYPGKYFVQTTDNCNNSFSDTVQVFVTGEIDFDLGPDIFKCAQDSATIKAPDGFINYTWNSDNNISNTVGKVVSVWPAVDTMYTVVAKLKEGCIVMDSVRVFIHPGPSVNLGNDTSICAGETLLLKPVGSFDRLQWQDGSSDAGFIAKETGQYWVHATSANGCISRDTLEIKELYSPPAPGLGNELLMCENSSRILTTLNEFKTYTWQDGSTNRSFTATQPGLYWVEVTDINHCSARDSVEIKGYITRPTGFIDSVMELCRGKAVDLTAKANFEKYLWSDGTNKKTTSVNSPGSYWLQVTDASGCQSTDTIVVKEIDCHKGVSFPNAFSPNNDGRNDLFRPVMGGNVERFQLFVYNRYGQKVFESNNPQLGWNGTFRGKNQDSNVFVWYCKYKLVGEPEKLEKGTVILSR